MLNTHICVLIGKCLFRRNQARAHEAEMYSKANEARKAESSTAAVAAHAPVRPHLFFPSFLRPMHETLAG
jgi:hypothetical protein